MGIAQDFMHYGALVRCFLTIIVIFGFCEEAPRKLVWISLDGLASHCLNRKDAPNIFKLMEMGVYSLSLEPVFPSQTFPNHFTQATGLSPDDHGIVDNTIIILDVDNEGRISRFNKDSSDPMWWNPKNTTIPIWTANEMHSDKHKSASIFWPGSKVEYMGRRISKYKQVYDHSSDVRKRIGEVIEYMETGIYNLIMVYIDEIDQAGHKYGACKLVPQASLKSVDKLFENLIKEANKHNFSIMVTSDHGMSTFNEKQLLVREDILGSSSSYTIVGRGAFFGIHVSGNGTEDKINRSRQLVEFLNKDAKKPYVAYMKEDLPLDLNYGKNKRIPQVIVKINNSYVFHEKKWAAGKEWGDHGWPASENKEMLGIFVGYGPLFAQGRMIDSMSNLDLYCIVCHLLGVQDSCLQNMRNKSTLFDLVARPKLRQKNYTKTDFFSSLDNDWGWKASLIIIGVAIIMLVVSFICTIVFKKRKAVSQSSLVILVGNNAPDAKPSMTSSSSQHHPIPPPLPNG